MNRLICASLLFAFLLFSYSGFTQTEKTKSECLVIAPKELHKANDDQITIQMDCPVVEFHFILMNRWGQVLYETESFTSPLDFDIHARMKGKRKKIGPELFIEGNIYKWQLDYREEGSPIVNKASGELYIH